MDNVKKRYVLNVRLWFAWSDRDGQVVISVYRVPFAKNRPQDEAVFVERVTGSSVR